MESVDALQVSLTTFQAPDLGVYYETARRWDGKLPATMLGGGTVPLLSLPGATPGR